MSLRTWRLMRSAKSGDQLLLARSLAANEAPYSRWSPRLQEVLHDVNLRRRLHSQQSREKHKKHSSGKTFRLPAFVFSALGFPIGWYLNEWRRRPYDSNDQPDPSDFVKYTLIGKNRISSTCSIFRLLPAENLMIDVEEQSLERGIVSVQIKQPQLQIARSYTCLPPEEGQDPTELRFLIRRECNGEVSGFLHRLPLGIEIELRGPMVDYVVPEDVTSVAFLAGGTGIAPALRVSNLIAGQCDMHILWACRSREDCAGGSSDTLAAPGTWKAWFWSQSRPHDTKCLSLCEDDRSDWKPSNIVSKLERLKPSSAATGHRQPPLLVDYYVDQEGKFITRTDVQRTMQSLDNNSKNEAGSKRILFVSGPEGFVNHWAGPKTWANGREMQGQLGGVLSTLDLNGWEIVKL